MRSRYETTYFDLKIHINILCTLLTAPGLSMAEMLKRTRAEARAMVSRDLVARDSCLTLKEVTNALDILRGATMIVYPMGLPPHEPIRLELENREDLSGTQVCVYVHLFEPRAQIAFHSSIEYVFLM